MLYPEIEKILTDNGYSLTDGFAYTYFCGILEAIDWVSNVTHKYVTVYVQLTEDYEKEILENKNNGKFALDMSRLEVTGIWFESHFVPESEFMSDDRSGIYLKDKTDRHKLLDMLGGQEGMKYYYTHDFKYLETAIFAQNHPFEHEENILKCHINNLEKINKIFRPVLEQYDFYQNYSSMFDVTKNNNMVRDTSDPFVIFKFKYSSILGSEVVFYTDCLDGRLKVNAENTFPKDFEKWLLSDFMQDKKNNKPYLEFRYIFDSDYLPQESYSNYFDITQKLEDYQQKFIGKDVLMNVSWNGLPMKHFQWLKDEYDRALID